MTQRRLNDLNPEFSPSHGLLFSHLHKAIRRRLPDQWLRPTAIRAWAGAMIMCMALPATAGAAGANSTFVAGQTSPLRDEITPQVRQTVRRGLKWLAARQNANGSFDSGTTAITALGGLAFVAGGNLPGQGRYAQNVSRALRYILDHCQRSGLIAGPTDADPMYSQGFATPAAERGNADPPMFSI